jgi:hypothetical protein
MSIKENMFIAEKVFHQMDKTPVYWHNKSANLKLSAKVLWALRDKDGAHYDNYKMLMGMSFEAMAKAFYIAQNRPLKLTHKIETLISEAGFQFDEIQNRTLKVLTEYIKWAAKYPTPKNKNGTGVITLIELWNEESNLGDDAFDYSKLHGMWRIMSDEYMSKYNPK